MLSNCEYNKVKILHDLSCVAWFVQQCCEKDAAECGGCKEKVAHLKKELSDMIDRIKSVECK